MKIAPATGLFFVLSPITILRKIPLLSAATLLLLLPACGAPRPPVSPCWVQLFAQPDFSPAGDHDILFGPAEFADLRQLPRAQRSDWGGAVRSMVTGPAATAVFWPQEGFGGTLAKVDPGTAVADLLPLQVDGARSLAIACPQ